ncbi:hypothetical protein ACH5RR_032862 [Cinchona calisaya]|uniref:Uncharacterized protein n=1 Tax=Cinchona calisaya TaxID=153742 RepID=A0ABD2YMV8_9GENT
MADSVVLVDGISKLPEHIRHHILSFLNPKEAAKTSVLSKAWLSTCRTRPNLHFITRPLNAATTITDTDIDIQVRKRKGNDFMNCINTTLLRYHENKCGIDTLKIRLSEFSAVASDHVNTWLKIAVENGVKNLKIGTNDSFVLPRIIFEAKSLVKLWLGKFQLKPQVIQIISCRGLQKLSLVEVNLDEVMLQRIISNCPLINYLKIEDCTGLVNIKVTKLQKLKELNIGFQESGIVEVEAPSLEDFLYANCTLSSSYSDDEGGPLPLLCWLQIYACKNLKILWLFNVAITEEFLTSIAENFPLLKGLTIQNCNHLQTIKISSHSIKHLTLLTNWELKEVCIDVPSIVRFEYRENSIPLPLFSFTAPLGPWVSNIDLQCLDWDILVISWFARLKELLANLNKSTISLELKFPMTVEEFTEDEMRNSAVFPVPKVQKLSIGFEAMPYLDSIYLVLDGIFWTCRPKTIVQYWHHDSKFSNNTLVKVLFEMLMLSNLKQTKVWQQDLNDVKLEMLENGQRVRFPELLDWETFVKSMKMEESTRSTCLVFHLEWETDVTRKRKRTQLGSSKKVA